MTPFGHADTSLHTDRLGLITAFVAVGECRSFGKAADALQVSSSSISRKITRLENDLGVLLFNRTTRRVSLTEAGRLYYNHCRGILESISEGDEMIKSLNSEPRGLLRITAPVALGRTHISAIASDFLMRYPSVQIEASFTDRFTDLVGEEFDIAIRIGTLPDSGLVARKIVDNQRLLLASRSFIERHGQPAAPEDLAAFNCLRFSRYTSSGNIWQLRRNDNTVSVVVNGNFKADSSEAVFSAVQRGLGIGVVARYIWESSHSRDDLVVLLPEWEVVPDAAIYVIYPSRRHLAPKVRAFTDFVVESFGKY